jgi:hypothetical protein
MMGAARTLNQSLRLAAVSAPGGVLALLTVLLASLFASGVRAQTRTLTASQSIPITISSDEFPQVNARYMAALDQRRRIIGNPWIRRATLGGPVDGARRLADDFCEESSAVISGYPCTGMPAAFRDRVEYSWFAGSPVTRFTNELNRATPTRLTLALSPAGSNSLLFPGTILRFVSGVEVPHIPPWRTMTTLPVGEDTGWILNSITVHPSSPAAAGNSLPPTITPYERFSGVLLGGTSTTNDEVYTLLPTSTRAQSLAVWLDESVPTGTLATVMVRCGSRPTVSNNWAIQTIGKTAPWLYVLPTCSSGWHAVVRYTGTTSVSFHMRAGEHYADKHRTYVSVAFQNSTANQAERDRGRMLVRQAAWRFYGMTGGTHIVTGFDWRPDCSNDIDRVTICIRNRPTTDGCTEGTGHASWPGALGGRMHICTDTSASNPLSGAWMQGRSSILGHEMVHAFVEIGDEYWRPTWPSLICGHGGFNVKRCHHSTMSYTWHGGQINTLCTPATHNAVTEYIQEVSGGVNIRGVVRGPNTLSECLNGDIVSNGPHQNSGWEHMWTTSRVPYPHPAYTPDNYSFELFGNTPDITVLGGHSN